MASGSTMKNRAINYEDVIIQSVSVTSNGMTALQLSQTFDSEVVGVEIKRAWPASNWNGGALVNIVQWDYNPSTGVVGVTLSTNSVQAYGITFRVYYED